ncbi:MAG: AMP-binding protein [Pseudomonadota bacterium]
MDQDEATATDPDTPDGFSVPARDHSARRPRSAALPSHPVTEIVSHKRPPAWLSALLRAWFRLDISGAAHLRGDTPVVYVSNHLSVIDAPLIAALTRRRCVVAMHTEPPTRGLAGLLWRWAGLDWIDISDSTGARTFLRRVRDGDTAIVFPEGRMSLHGGLMKVYPEAARLLDATQAPLVPVHLDGLDMSRWSHAQPGHPRHMRPRVHIQIGPPVPRPEGAGKLTARALRDLLERTRFQALHRWPNVPAALADTARRLHSRETAIEDPLGNALTLGRVAAGAAALGARLRPRTDPGEVIGLLLPGVASVPAVLSALWREGRVPALLNPTLGAGPAKAAIAAAGIRCVLSSRAFVEQGALRPMIDAFEGAGIEIVWTEDLRAEIGLFRRLRALIAPGRPVPAKHDDPAVVLFTSGTEGAPKAVVLSHGNLLGNVAQLRARTDVGPGDRVLLALPLFHSLGLTGGLLFPMLCGARLLIYPTPLHYKVIPELAYMHQATLIFGTDTFFAGWGRRADPNDFTSVRAAIAGAEPLKPGTRKLWVDRFGVRITEGYGATETSPVLALNTPADDRFGTVGRFLPAVETRLEPVPGIPGARLWVKGPNVMLGYMRTDDPGMLVPLTDG